MSKVSKVKKKPATRHKKNASKRSKLEHLGFWELLKKTTNTLINNYRIIGAISVVYGILYFLFSNGVNLLDISELRAELQETFDVDPETVGGQFLLAGLVFQTASALDQVGATYMLFATLFTVLALLWVLRHIWAKKKTTLKEAFYKGMYPIIPFTLLFGLAILQLLPFIIGTSLLDTALSNSILNGGVEIAIGSLVLLVLPAIWTIKMLIRTMMAMIIVTIPDMAPMEAYGVAKDLLKGKQAYVMRQLLSLTFLVLILLIALLVTFVAVAPSLSVIISVLINIFVLPLGMVFVYSIYRELI